MPEQFKLINWIFNGEDDLSSENKRKKEEYAYGMHILEIGTNRVVFQFGKNKLNH